MRAATGLMLGCVVCLVLLASSSIQAAEPIPHITGMFSRVRTLPEGGDLGGAEMWIVNSNEGYWVVLQEYPDYPIRPVMAKLTVKGNVVDFDIPPPSPAAGNYHGRVTAKGFEGNRIGHMDNGEVFNEPLELRRQQTYWQTH
jgi:hypothetical protein